MCNNGVWADNLIKGSWSQGPLIRGTLILKDFYQEFEVELKLCPVVPY